jgi:S1-C subfamily serine protease
LAGAVFLLATLNAFAEPSGSLSQVFKRVSNAVVVIRTAERVPARGSVAQPVSIAGIGSGVLISPDGKVVTAAHVVQTADAVAVEFPGEVIVRARVVASDPAADVALLQLEHVPAGATTVRLGDSDRVEVGDQVFVVGAPLGISRTLTVGHLSARRTMNATSGGVVSRELFQTDASINQGNSGGPLFDMNGNVIGIVSYIMSRSGGSDGLGFVVTSNTARRLLLDERTVWSGLDGYLLTGELARAFNLPTERGALLVQRVALGSPAERLGLRGGTMRVAIGQETILLGGDVILAVEGIGLGSPQAYEAIRRRLIELRAGSRSIRVTVLRGGATTDLTGLIDG